MIVCRKAGGRRFEVGGKRGVARKGERGGARECGARERVITRAVDASQVCICCKTGSRRKPVLGFACVWELVRRKTRGGLGRSVCRLGKTESVGSRLGIKCGERGASNFVTVLEGGRDGWELDAGAA